MVHLPKRNNLIDSKNALVRNTADPSMISEAEQRPNRNSRRAKSASSTSLSYLWRRLKPPGSVETWKDLQGRFVDNPKGAVVQADQLVRELMLKRGYPMGDFERRAADISVDHPEVVAHYRAAQAIAVRDERGEADTEELRKAVVHYRALFDELLEVREAKQEVMPEKQMEVRFMNRARGKKSHYGRFGSRCGDTDCTTRG